MTQKSFDQLLAGILTDYRNMWPEADLSQGSLIWVRASALASALWGAYRHQAWVARQIFPDTADRELLERHALVRGLEIVASESDEDLLARVLEDIRTPPAGGNRYDYPRWAREVEGCANGWLYTPASPEQGSVYMVVTADPDPETGSEVPSASLLAAVESHIDYLRPVSARNIYIGAPTITAQNVTITGSGDDWDPAQAAADLEALMLTFVPGDGFSLAQIYYVCIANGATNCVISTPPADVTPLATEILRPGVINVT